MARILSIEFNNRSIKVLEGSKGSNSLTVFKSIYLVAPLNSIDDGKIIDMDAVVEIIKNAFIENKIKTKNAIFIINTNSIITRNIELPLLKSKSETMSMIKNELEQLMPVDLSQYKLVYKKTENVSVDNLQNGKYMVYGLPINILNSYLELAEKLNLNISALDLSFNSLDQISKHKITVNKHSLKSDAATAFINISYNTLTFSVVNNGVNDFSRISANGIQDIVENYSALNNLNHEESLKEIQRLSLINNEGTTNLNVNVLEEEVSIWVDEISRYIRYYNSQNKDRAINKIFIYGTYSNINGLEEYISSHLNIEAEKIEEISGLTLKENKFLHNFDAKVFLNIVLSLYIDKKDINFLSDKKKRHKSKFRYGIVLMALALAILLTAAYYIYSYMVEKMTLENNIATLDEYINNTENIKRYQEAINIINKADLMEKYKDEVNKLQTSIKYEDAVTSIIFDEVAKAQPLGTRVNSMSIDKTSIQLQCSSATRQEVAQFEKNLKKIEFVGDVHIPAVVDTAEGGNVSYSYSVVCSLKDVIVNEAE